MSVRAPAASTALYALLLAFFALSLLGSWAGWDVLGDTEPTIWGVILVVWFGIELRRESGRWMRRVLWGGIASGAVLAIGTMAELVVG